MRRLFPKNTAADYSGSMSLKRNILANYASQTYVTVIAVLMVPLYLQYMGIEAYGLVGFFTMLQAWFNLLDIGLTPTIARETARFRGGAIDAISYRRLVRALQAIFLAIALAGGGALFASAGIIASKWLKVQALPLSEVHSAVQMMVLGVALRWMAGLYRGCISGSEWLVWLGGYNAIIATLRYVCVLPVLMFVGTTSTVFFSYQLFVAVLELVGLAVSAYRLLPRIPAGHHLGYSVASIKPILKFSFTIAFTSSVWVLVTQIDKLVLSKLLSLADYGYFTLAVLGSWGVMITTAPISAALIPRLTRLEAQGDSAGLIKLYRDATQMVCVIAFPVAFTLAAFAEQVVWAWTGDPVAVANAAPILRLYAVGNGILALSAFPYYLQYAKGDLKLHLIGNAIFLLLLIPSLVWGIWIFGGMGAGWAWLLSNLVYFLCWIPLVHRRFERGLHKLWLIRDVAPLLAVSGVTALILSAVADEKLSRPLAAAVPVALGVMTFALTGATSDVFRALVGQLRKKR